LGKNSVTEGLKIIDNNNAIASRIKHAVNKQLREGAIDNKLILLNHKLQALISLAFLKSETYVSLVYGELRAEFGLNEEAVNNLPDLIEKIVNTYIYINFSAKKNGLAIIEIGISDYDDIDFSKDGMFVTEKGDIINWLWWLLSAGDSQIQSIDGYGVYLKQGQGRSKMAIMIKTQGQSYSVDSYFAGTPYDNWITRTLRANQKEIQDIIKVVMNAP
jgi:hypothetical protein